MILYSIRRKSDKKFFTGFRWYDGKPTFCTKGPLYRNIETALRNLKWLCADEVYIGHSRRYGSFKRHEPSGFTHQRLRSYEIMIYDVRIHKPTRCVQAGEFFKKQKRKRL